jgi:ABC-type dipeptide/oligopeptide/nickel transport system permease subunit
MRLLNWRRQAVLNAMPGLKPDHIRTPWSEFWRRFRRQPVAMTAGLFVLLLIVVAIVAPWVAPFDAENYFDYDRLNDGPSMLHWFGVDSLGRDIFSRVLVGAQISLAAGVFAVLIGAAIGTVLGLLPGITKAGGTASSCASATCCLPFPAFCWRLPWWRSWAAAWRTSSLRSRSFRFRPLPAWCAATRWC